MLGLLSVDGSNRIIAVGMTPGFGSNFGIVSVTFRGLFRPTTPGNSFERALSYTSPTLYTGVIFDGVELLGRPFDCANRTFLAAQTTGLA
jgi:hypothetical protein